MASIEDNDEVTLVHLRPQLVQFEIVRILGEVEPGVVDLNDMVHTEASTLRQTIVTVLDPDVEQVVIM